VLYYKVRKLENGVSLVLPITCFLGKGHYVFGRLAQVVENIPLLFVFEIEIAREHVSLI